MIYKMFSSLILEKISSVAGRGRGVEFFVIRQLFHVGDLVGRGRSHTQETVIQSVTLTSANVTGTAIAVTETSFSVEAASTEVTATPSFTTTTIVFTTATIGVGCESTSTITAFYACGCHSTADLAT